MGELGYSRDIARASLGIDAIMLRPDEPFTWASGYRMPIYNDNRRLLGNADHRALVTGAFARTIAENNLRMDYVAGTTTAGIAPAASLALALHKQLLIFDQGQPYLIPLSNTPQANPPADVVATTCPWAILDGIHAANTFKLPFMYVRENPKAHGLKQQVEGITSVGQSAFLLDFHRGKSYMQDAVSALEEKGVSVTERISADISGLFRPARLEGANVLVIEDLVSTGGSSVKEVQQYREAGATVTHCLSIFNYGFAEAQKLFDEADCTLHSALDYDILINTAMQLQLIEGHQVALLQEWRNAPFQWGEKHGFPKVEKK